jgi:hypothetical protein
VVSHGCPTSCQGEGLVMGGERGERVPKGKDRRSRITVLVESP